MLEGAESRPAGMYSDFDWATAPLSSFWAPCAASAAYLVLVFILPKVVPSGGLPGMQTIFVGHNLLLSALSLVMFVGCLRELLTRGSQAQSFDWMFCERPGRGSGPLYFWSYIFYISKYYELVDTVIALLKGSRPPHMALHVYHHAIMPIMTWHWLEYSATLQYGGLLFNTLVHVIMYAYYALKVLKVPTPWKSWITRLQILQFMTSIVLLGVSWQYHLDGQPLNPKCAGMTTLWVNIVFNMTLLWQFVGVLFTPPRERKERGGKAA